MTIIDICNNALADIGHDREITSLDPAADSSAEARRCALFYPRALADIVHRHPWRFLTQTIPGAAVAVGTVDPLPGFESVYAPPAAAAAIQSAVDADGAPVPYTVQDGLIHARRDVDTFAFTSADLAADPSLWPPPSPRPSPPPSPCASPASSPAPTPPSRPPHRPTPKPSPPPAATTA